MRIHPDRAAAAVIVAAAAATYVLTFGFDEVPAALAQGLGPREFPRLLLIIIALLAMVTAVQARGQSFENLPRIDWTVWLLMAAIPAYILLLWLVGLPVSMGIALFALGLLWGERRRGMLMIHAIAMPTVLWLMFVKGLKVQLPTGVLGQMIGA